MILLLSAYCLTVSSQQITPIHTSSMSQTYTFIVSGTAPVGQSPTALHAATALHAVTTLHTPIALQSQTPMTSHEAQTATAVQTATAAQTTRASYEAQATATAKPLPSPTVISPPTMPTTSFNGMQLAGTITAAVCFTVIICLCVASNAPRNETLPIMSVVRNPLLEMQISEKRDTWHMSPNAKGTAV